MQSKYLVQKLQRFMWFCKNTFYFNFVFEAFKTWRQHVYKNHEKDPFALELVTYESYSFVNTYLLCLERASFFQRMFLSFIIAFFPIKLFVWVKATNHFMHNCDVNKSFLFMSYTPTFYKRSISTWKSFSKCQMLFWIRIRNKLIHLL